CVISTRIVRRPGRDFYERFASTRFSICSTALLNSSIALISALIFSLALSAVFARIMALLASCVLMNDPSKAGHPTPRGLHRPDRGPTIDNHASALETQLGRVNLCDTNLFTSEISKASRTPRFILK